MTSAGKDFFLSGAVLGNVPPPLWRLVKMAESGLRHATRPRVFQLQSPVDFMSYMIYFQVFIILNFILRVLVDRPRVSSSILVLGSASPELLRRVPNRWAAASFIMSSRGFPWTRSALQTTGGCGCEADFPGPTLPHLRGAGSACGQGQEGGWAMRSCSMLLLGSI